MNANEASNTRLQRIKTVSRIARWVVIGFFLFAACLSFVSALCSLSPPDYFRRPLVPLSDPRFLLLNVVQFVYQVVLCVWYWKLAQLFRLYERGRIFVAETIGCIKNLGSLCVIGGVFMSLTRIIARQIEIVSPFPPANLPAGVTVARLVTFHIGFFSFDFGTGIDFGLLLAGIAIVLVAWIMDEGRKIQEEQELTV